MDLAAGHVRLLMRDFSSHTGAAVNDWSWPVSREALVAMDHYDAYVNATYKRARRQPRPWDKPTLIGRTNLTPDRAREVLRRNARG